MIRNPDFTIVKSTINCDEYTFIPVSAPSTPIITHSWLVFDGTAWNPATNPQVLPSGGTYQIYHQINYSDGGNDYCESITKTLTTETFDPSFTHSNVCSNYTFQSTGILPAGTTHSWSFGDGSEQTSYSISASTTHDYGSYTGNPNLNVFHYIKIDACIYQLSQPITINVNSAPFTLSGDWSTLTNADNVPASLFTEKECIIPGECGSPIQTSAANPNVFFRFQNPASKGFQLIFKYGIIDGINYGTIAAPTFKLYKYDANDNILVPITQRNYTISNRLKISYYDDDPNAIFMLRHLISKHHLAPLQFVLVMCQETMLFKAHLK
ncbi:MAG: hypothetical protein IPF63_10310 [Bacteroidetes bacterium]|nr:hypothetical protein [Bacteroidota bacterium]